MKTFTIGDVHGMIEQLRLLWSKIEAAEPDPSKRRVIFLGDLVDRGDNSAEVLRFVKEKVEMDLAELVMGNHEEMMLEGLRSWLQEMKRGEFTAPYSFDYHWLQNGGYSTLSHLQQAKDAYNLVDFVVKRSRVYLEDERRYYFHAGMSPNRTVNEHDAHELRWIREVFLESRKPFPKYVVHGHTPVKFDPKNPDREKFEALILENRTNLDTACFFSGVLSCGVFDDSQDKPLEILTAYVQPARERNK